MQKNKKKETTNILNNKQNDRTKQLNARTIKKTKINNTKQKTNILTCSFTYLIIYYNPTFLILILSTLPGTIRRGTGVCLECQYMICLWFTFYSPFCSVSFLFICCLFICFLFFSFFIFIFCLMLFLFGSRNLL